MSFIVSSRISVVQQIKRREEEGSHRCVHCFCAGCHSKKGLYSCQRSCWRSFLQSLILNTAHSTVIHKMDTYCRLIGLFLPQLDRREAGCLHHGWDNCSMAIIWSDLMIMMMEESYRGAITHCPTLEHKHSNNSQIRVCYRWPAGWKSTQELTTSNVTLARKKKWALNFCTLGVFFRAH